MLELIIAGMATLFDGQNVDIDQWYQVKSAQIMDLSKGEKAPLIFNQQARFTVFDGQYVRDSLDGENIVRYYLYTFAKGEEEYVEVEYEVMNCTLKEKLTYIGIDIGSKKPSLTGISNPKVASVGQQDKMYSLLCL